MKKIVVETNFRNGNKNVDISNPFDPENIHSTLRTTCKYLDERFEDENGMTTSVSQNLHIENE